MSGRGVSDERVWGRLVGRRSSAPRALPWVMAAALVAGACFGAAARTVTDDDDVDPRPADDGDVDPRPGEDDDVDPSYPKPKPAAKKPDQEDDRADEEGDPPPVVPAPAAPVPLPSASPEPAPAPGADVPPPDDTPPPSTSPPGPSDPGPVRAPPRALDGEDAVVVPAKGPPRPPIGLMTLQALPVVFVGAGGKGSVNIGDQKRASALRVSFGMGLDLDFPVHRFFALGTRAMVGFWNTERLERAGYGRSVFADIALNLRGRLPIMRDRAEVYVAVPVGFSVGLLNDVLSTTTGKGWVIGTHLGLKVYAKPSWGFVVEAGWVRHAWKQRHDPNAAIDGKAPVSVVVPEGEVAQPRVVRSHIQQFVFHLGVVFRL